MEEEYVCVCDAKLRHARLSLPGVGPKVRRILLYEWLFAVGDDCAAGRWMVKYEKCLTILDECERLGGIHGYLLRRRSCQ